MPAQRLGALTASCAARLLVAPSPSMAPKSSAARTQASRGSERAKGWLYEVLNPWIEGVHAEIGRLKRRDVTFRAHDQRLERIRILPAYLTLNGAHIFRDYSRARPTITKWVDAHDALVGALAGEAQRAFAELLGRRDFISAVREEKAAYRAAGGKYPGGAWPEEEFPKVVIENIVNERDRLPSMNTDADFWSKHRDRLREKANLALLAPLRAARQALLEEDTKLVKKMSDESFRLCETYDIPAAPIAREL